LAFWAAKSLNGKQRYCGWKIDHGSPPRIGHERKSLGHR
jgi:hypothetical protein